MAEQGYSAPSRDRVPPSGSSLDVCLSAFWGDGLCCGRTAGLPVTFTVACSAPAEALGPRSHIEPAVERAEFSPRGFGCWGKKTRLCSRGFVFVKLLEQSSEPSRRSHLNCESVNLRFPVPAVLRVGSVPEIVALFLFEQNLVS